MTNAAETGVSTSSDAAITASAAIGIGVASTRGSSGASARAIVTQHEGLPRAGDFEPCERLAAWSGQTGAALSPFSEPAVPIEVHAIGVPRTAPITQ